MKKNHYNQKVVCVDIGNSSTSVALIDNTLTQCIKKNNFPTSEIKDHIYNIFTDYKNYLKTPYKIKICSVVSNLAEDIANLIDPIPQINTISLITYKGSLPFKINYTPKKNLGNDRIADALFAAYFYPGKDIVIIDAGTAVTIDLLTNDKIFQGGVIYPGIDLQFISLAEHTSKLPKLKEKKINDFKIPNSTEDAIKTGIHFSIAGGIEKYIKQIKQQFPNIEILASGGNWPTISKFVNLNVEYIADLTLLGISLYEEY